MASHSHTDALSPRAAFWRALLRNRLPALRENPERASEPAEMKRATSKAEAARRCDVKRCLFVGGSAGMMRLCQRVKRASRPGSHAERLIDLPSIVTITLMPFSGWFWGERVHARKKSPLFKTEIKCMVHPSLCSTYLKKKKSLWKRRRGKSVKGSGGVLTNSSAEISFFTHTHPFFQKLASGEDLQLCLHAQISPIRSKPWLIVNTKATVYMYTK